MLVWVVPASLGSGPLLPAYVAPSLSFRKLFLLPLAFVGLRLGRVSCSLSSCCLSLQALSQTAFKLASVVTKVLLKYFRSKTSRSLKLLSLAKYSPHIVTDIAFQAVHNCRKLNEVRNMISRKLLIPDHLLLPSIVLLQERSWFRIKARSHEAFEKLEVVTPLASGEKQVELPPSFPAIGGLKPLFDLKLGLPLGLLGQEKPKLSSGVLYLKFVALKLKFEVLL